MVWGPGSISLSGNRPAKDRGVEHSRRLPFSLPAFLLAPWPVPLACSTLLVLGSPGHQPMAFFFVSLAAELVVSYLGTAALVVCLHFIAQARPVTRIISAVTGLVLAGLACLSFVYINWHASGPDSGPPLESFPVYFLRNWNDPTLGVFLAAGLVAALLYDAIARRKTKRPSASPVRSAL